MVRHLFMECNFSKETWKEALGLCRIPKEVNFLSGSVPNILEVWHILLRSKGLNKPENSVLVQLKKTLLKSLMWCLWIERNKAIFNDKNPSIERVILAAKRLTIECVMPWFSKRKFSKESNDQEELIAWNLTLPDQTIIGKDLEKDAENQRKLQIKLKEGHNLLFFYGASKLNPGQAGIGGLLVLPKKMSRLAFWKGLGIASNNRVEGLALRKGLVL
eukprot:Gb_10309 [translate_table: standard]